MSKPNVLTSSDVAPPRLEPLAAPLDGTGPEERFEGWRRLMEPVYDVGPLEAGALPSGGVTLWQVGDLVLNHAVFDPQVTTRDRRRIDGTPDPLVLQVWGVGGFEGSTGTAPLAFAQGRLAVVDRRRPLTGRVRRTDSRGLILPRERLHGVDLERLGPQLDPDRERALTALIVDLWRRLPRLAPPEADATAEAVVAGVRRILSASSTRDLLEGPELDGGLRVRAEVVLRRRLGERELRPEEVAAELGVSRATLYRAFAATGGVAAWLTEQRLLIARARLEDPAERLTGARLAAGLAFGSAPAFSRAFRRRCFGASPGEWRSRRLAELRTRAEADAARAVLWRGRPPPARETPG